MNADALTTLLVAALIVAALASLAMLARALRRADRWEDAALRATTRERAAQSRIAHLERRVWTLLGDTAALDPVDLAAATTPVYRVSAADTEQLRAAAANGAPTTRKEHHR